MIIKELETQMLSRKDLKNFLSPGDIQQLNEIMYGYMVVDTQSFYKIFDRLITLQKLKALRAIEVEKAVKILTTANTAMRIENFKYDDEKQVIYKYDPLLGHHAFFRAGTRKDYEVMLRVQGRYYD